MERFGLIMKSHREREGLSQAELAKKIGISRSAISNYENGLREPDFETEERIADYFGINLDSLRGRQTGGYAVSLKVLGYVAAGIPLEMITDIVDDEEISAQMSRTGDYFALRIKGNSMQPLIMDGDNVIVKVQPDVDSGDIAVVAVNGENATCKTIRKTSAGIMLIPKNAEYEPMFYTHDEVEQIPITILGKVVELRRKL